MISGIYCWHCTLDFDTSFLLFRPTTPDHLRLAITRNTTEDSHSESIHQYAYLPRTMPLRRNGMDG
jgi:hypothetical protein